LENILISVDITSSDGLSTFRQEKKNKLSCFPRQKRQVLLAGGNIVITSLDLVSVLIFHTVSRAYKIWTCPCAGLTVEDVQTITMVICCDYSAGLVLLQLLGEFVGISSVFILGPCYASERLCDLVCLHCQVRFTWYSTSPQYQTSSQHIAYSP
jgi:hypothetical protein